MSKVNELGNASLTITSAHYCRLYLNNLQLILATRVRIRKELYFYMVQLLEGRSKNYFDTVCKHACLRKMSLLLFCILTAITFFLPKCRIMDLSFVTSLFRHKKPTLTNDVLFFFIEHLQNSSFFSFLFVSTSKMNSHAFYHVTLDCPLFSCPCL